MPSQSRWMDVGRRWLPGLSAWVLAGVVLAQLSACAPRAVVASTPAAPAMPVYRTGQILHELSNNLPPTCPDAQGVVRIGYSDGGSGTDSAGQKFVAEVLKQMVLRSGCFVLVKRALSPSALDEERGLIAGQSASTPAANRQLAADYVLFVDASALSLPDRVFATIEMVDTRSRVLLIQAVGYPSDEAVETTFHRSASAALARDEALTAAVYAAYTQLVTQAQALKRPR